MALSARSPARVAGPCHRRALQLQHQLAAVVLAQAEHLVGARRQHHGAPARAEGPRGEGQPADGLGSNRRSPMATGGLLVLMRGRDERSDGPHRHRGPQFFLIF